MRGVINFLKRVEWVNYEQLRGMEIQKHYTFLKDRETVVPDYSFKINHWYEIFYFFVEARYLALVPDALGSARWLYVRVPDRRYNRGMYFYFAPWGWLLLLRQGFGYLVFKLRRKA